MIAMGYHTLLINSKSWVSLQAQNPRTKRRYVTTPRKDLDTLPKPYIAFLPAPLQKDSLCGWLCVRKEGVIKSYVDCWANLD